ncbi:hypothetical protein EVAR_50340_1 [Eumeta japonica]|uniref:Uncharacterized protein n=1 Tax=Eumeta variegata TaxID=151549 RepID=A0A4C1XQH6_EUMVA|nr:hypothetical protein EVAR_50340_1 [Eumeta japonica]
MSMGGSDHLFFDSLSALSPLASAIKENACDTTVGSAQAVKDVGVALGIKLNLDKFIEKAHAIACQSGHTSSYEPGTTGRSDEISERIAETYLQTRLYLVISRDELSLSLYHCNKIHNAAILLASHRPPGAKGGPEERRARTGARLSTAERRRRERLPVAGAISSLSAWAGRSCRRRTYIVVDDAEPPSESRLRQPTTIEATSPQR